MTHLPRYFLADLPPEATLAPKMISEACVTLKRNREQYLALRSTANLVRVLGNVGEAWRMPDYHLRKLALELTPAETGFSRATLESGLDAFFSRLTEENLEALIAQEFGHPRRLDALSASPQEQRENRAAIARGPRMKVHFAAGNLPNPTFMSIILGLLLRSAQFVKCGSGSALLTRLFAHSIYEVEPKLGACLEIAEWPGGSDDLEKELFAEADCVTATGSDEAIETIGGRLPASMRYVTHGHRVSFGYITRDVLCRGDIRDVVSRAANDVVAWNQLGCLSPHVFYVEKEGAIAPEHFAEMLADELARRERSEPRGPLSSEESAEITSRRALYEVLAAHSPGTRHWCSPGSTAWTVIYESNPRFRLSCMNRFIYVKGVKDLEEALVAADEVHGKVSTVGLGATYNKARELAHQFAHWGVTRVCPIGQMQNPPLSWRHDGRPLLGDLITWTDMEWEP